MIPPPAGPGDILPGPETGRPILRGGEMPLVLQALEEIDAIKRSVGDLAKRLEALEGRVSALEARLK